MLAALLPLVPLLAQVVPQIASWIGGDDAEEVARQVTGVVTTVAGNTDEAALAAAMADPAQRAALTEQLARIAAERERVKQEAITARLQAALADTASARDQTVRLAAQGSRIAWAPAILSALIISGFFVCIVMLFVVDRVWDERTAGLMNALFGALTISFGQVANYWLGSSRGSAAKDERQEAAMAVATAAAAHVATRAPEPAGPPPSPGTSGVRPLFRRN